MSQQASRPTRVWLLRHGERMDHVDSNWLANAERPFDPPLTPAGHEQARRAGLYFKEKGIQFTRIYCSPFTRCLQTATEVANVLDLPIHVEFGAAEWVCKLWTPGLKEPLHLTFDPARISPIFPRVDLEYYPHKLHVREVPIPERQSQVRERYLTTLAAKALEHANEDILFVSHGQLFHETHTAWLKEAPSIPYAAIAAFEHSVIPGIKNVEADDIGEEREIPVEHVWSVHEPLHATHWQGKI